MKTLFICGAMEQGKDGVGDYTRRLAGELIRQGHQSTIIAYNDRYIMDPTESLQHDDGTSIVVLRLPAVLRAKEKIQLAQDYIKQFQPDWISLQFVIYAFHIKGLPFSLTRQLRKIGGRHKWHIMLHELWVGNADNSMKRVLLHRLQKYLVNKLISKLPVKIMHTSISTIQTQIGRQCLILPLFGNIPVESFYKSTDKNNHVYKAVIFGSFSSDLMSFERQIKWLKTLKELTNKQICIQIIGDGGSFKEKSVKIIYDHFDPAQISDLGRLPEDQISKLFQQADIGISRANVDTFGKSGSTMAMLEHGLIVLLKGKEVHIENYLPPLLMDFQNQICFVSSNPLSINENKNMPRGILNKVAQQFIDNLNNKVS